MPTVEQLPISLDVLLGYVTSGLIAVLVLVAGWMISKWARRFVLHAGGKTLNQAAAQFVSGIVQYAVIAATVITALGAVGVETTSLVAVFASAGLAVGLALQGSLSSFASGVMILVFKPFDLGDFVTIAGSTGTVVDIGVFATTLHTPDNHKVIIPNAAITTGTIVNLTALGTRRGTVEVGVAYGADVPKVLAVLQAAATRSGRVLADPAPVVMFVGMGASSIDFIVNVWCVSSDYMDMLHEVRHAAYDALNEAGIEIPFPQVVVHRADA